MITLIIGLNVVIALFGFYVAWRIWQLKRALTSATVALTAWERQAHTILNPETTPGLIRQGKQATALTREGYARLLNQIHQLQRIFVVALVGLRLLRGTGLRRLRISKR